MRIQTSIRSGSLAVLVAAVVMTGAVDPSFLVGRQALADDGDGGGGGAGGGGGGAGGDSANPFKNRSQRRSTQTRCTCSFLVICSCSTRTTRAPSKPTTKAVKVEKPRSPGSKEAKSSSPRPEIIVSGLDDGAIASLTQRGFVVRGQRSSSLLGTSIVRLAVPPGRSAGQSLSTVRSVSGVAALAARNDSYRRLLLAYKPAGQSCGRTCETFSITAWTESIGSCSAETRIGMVDTGVDRNHPSLKGASLKLNSVRSSDRAASDTDHGTAVASLLVGQLDGQIAGLVPKATLFAADAFHGSGSSSAADAYDLIAALDWLADESVALVNLSLSGPDNELLKTAVGSAQKRGMRLVAAAGKPGESANNGFPARYEGVIAVSAIDMRLRPSRHTIRGEHIAFVAPGVGVVVAAPNEKLRVAEGSSFAAPFVTAAFAMADRKAGTAESADAIKRLATTAKDLGSLGRDPVFGWGLVQLAGLPSCER